MGTTAEQDKQQGAAAAGSRLADLRALRAEKAFDPFEVIIDEIQRKGTGKGRLTAKEKVQAADALARLELDYEKFEFAKAQPKSGGIRGKVTAGPDGQMSFDFEADLGAVADDDLDAAGREIARRNGWAE